MVDFKSEFEDIKKLITSTQKAVQNLDEISSFTGLSKSTIYKLTSNGKIPHYKKAKHLFFDRKEIESWLKENPGFNRHEIIMEARHSLNTKSKGLEGTC